MDLELWFVYVVKCSDDSLYTGITNDIQKRVKVHNAGKGAAYTKTRLPVELVYFEAVANKSSALKREYQIKRLSRQAKLDLIGKMEHPQDAILH